MLFSSHELEVVERAAPAHQTGGRPQTHGGIPGRGPAYRCVAFLADSHVQTAVATAPELSCPRVIRTLQLGSSVAVWPVRGLVMLPVALKGDTGVGVALGVGVGVGVWVGKMMIDHRHEHEIGTVVSERKRLCRPLPVGHVSDRGLAASLSHHL